MHFLDRLINSDLGELKKRSSVTCVDDSSTSLPTGNLKDIIVDGVSLSINDKILYTNLSNSDLNNRIYSVHSHGETLSLGLVSDGTSANGSPSDGDFIYVLNGNVYSQSILGFDGVSWKKVDFNSTLATAGPTLIAGSNITLTPVGSTITIASTGGGGSVTNVTASAPLNSTGGTTPNISSAKADSTHDGYLGSVDWNTFNNKQASGNYITALTGDVTASGPGSVIAALKNIPNKVYVDFISGNDSNTGTLTSPWKTLQHAYNSISPSINFPYVIYLSGGNNSTDTSPITGKADVSIVADYIIQVPAITITSPVANSNGCTFVNLTFLGAVTWIRTDGFTSGATFINCEFFSGPIIKNTSTGACSVLAFNSQFVNSEFQLANGGFGVFDTCTFFGTTTFDDPGSSGLSYIDFDGGYSSGAVSFTGLYNPIYFTGFVHDVAFGASVSFVAGIAGPSPLEIDANGLPPTFTGTPGAITYLGQAKYVSTGSLTGVLKNNSGVIGGSATTSDLPEGSNLYYTDSRVQTAAKNNTTKAVLYVSNDDGNDANDGSLLKPFKTIQAAITAAEAIPSTFNTPIVIKIYPVATGTNGAYLENLSITQQGIILEAISNIYHSGAVTINGTHTINLTGTAGGANFSASNNECHFIGLTLLASGSSPIVTSSGTVYQKVLLENCFLQQTGTSSALSMTNTGTSGALKSTVTVRDTDFENNSASVATISCTAGNTFIAGANPSITNDTTGGPAIAFSGNSFTINNGSITGTITNSGTGSMTLAIEGVTSSLTGAVVANTSTGSITLAAVTLTNNTSTGSGISNAGGTITAFNCLFNIGTGTGAYVIKGTGTYVNAQNMFVSNTKYQNTLTFVAMSTTPTSAA